MPFTIKKTINYYANKKEKKKKSINIEMKGKPYKILR